MPVGKIGNLSVGRLISGSNLISMNMHARDLDYVSSLAAHYNTEERIFMTLKKCEEHGINTIVLKNHNFRRFRLKRYWDEWGGRMQWLADVITTDINKYERLLAEHLELGASAAYLWGGASDIWYYQKKHDNILKAFEIMKSYDIPVGIYHDQYHDNMFCHNAQQIIEFMQGVKVPWIAFKVLAAGAIGPEDGLNYAFSGGADFVCLGMFDFQVPEDVELTREAIATSKNRKRPWQPTADSGGETER